MASMPAGPVAVLFVYMGDRTVPLSPAEQMILGAGGIVVALLVTLYLVSAWRSRNDPPAPRTWRGQRSSYRRLGRRR